MDAATFDIIQSIAIVVVAWLMYKAGKKDGVYIGTLATLDYLEKQGIVKLEDSADQSA